MDTELPLLRDMRPAPMNRETAHVFVRETIRVGILNGHLPGGSRLIQSDLAAQLDVSTTPVREALRDLASEELVQIDPHRGAIVCELNVEDVEEIYLMRRQLEPLAVELAAPTITPADIDAARSLHEAMSGATDAASWVELNRKFHMALYAPCNRPRLLATIQELQNGSVLAVSLNIVARPDSRRGANDEHSMLIDAMEVGDVERATTVILDHINMSLQAMRQPSETGE